ncbi:hypothetical protein DAPPUDRAFT_318969 [Daphnia pulex]|uniref:Uncharacterized protein n=1 Tax=Daphnia pulex TaxID=6669 RepID=E9GKA1_DAPPU|nr:hypothetical protein DAPPUDRAFT_318967 [Daphnia pulex]EFX79952.1 hypothetical protein DAPPUDRAFT_318969 [Daphnia pulex]|eukprot:EFX79951.1 hypothetical protein DAPPUDRAFT_318967 [Daphnia pulex]
MSMKIEENYEEDYDEANYDKEEDDEEPGRQYEAHPSQEKENQSDRCNYDDAEPQEPIMFLTLNFLRITNDCSPLKATS